MSGSADDPPNPAAAHRIELPLPSLFSWPECLAYLGRSKLEVLHRIEGEQLVEVVDLDGHLVRLKIQPAKDTAMLLIEFPQNEPPEIRTAAACYVREWFGLDEDLEPFYAMAQKDPLLAPVVSAHRGLRLIGIPDLFEALAWAIIGQQINLPFAYTMKKRLVETYGEALPGEDPWSGPERLFPRPDVIAALAPDDLRPLQFSGRKAEYVIGAARLLEEGRLSKCSLLRMEQPEARETLLAIRGVGAWTADYVGIKCLRHPDAFPAGDAGLHQALKAGLGLDRKPLPAEIEQAAAGWRGFEAMAAFYLWQSLL
ncbi:DNA-3-methyladenine glycosylase [Saccharibacillus deserti]|uniref:DNA-3-methyladenine glycosylase 2 n=1 Tax=Saccharibacillus deserti TaxID=1634444 RepID=UPI0031B5EA79